MAGSEWEWISGPADAAQPSQGITRGAGWSDGGIYLAISNRGLIAVRYRGNVYGLRVCADVT
jgi:hypothetical protein